MSRPRFVTRNLVPDGVLVRLLVTSGVTLEVGRVQARRRKMAAVSGDSDSAWKLTLKSKFEYSSKTLPCE